jgi:hypothetical protein
MTLGERRKIGRLALRKEGDNWSAYYALPDTMEGALPLASIRMNAVQRIERKNAFMALMQDIVADLIEEIVGDRPTWNEPEAAPEHERGARPS